MAKITNNYTGDIVLGLMAGVTLSLGAVALSTLVFSGSLTDFLPLFMGLMLFGCACAGYLTAAFSQVATLLSAIQAAPAALIGAITAQLGTAAALADSATGLLSTTMAIISICTIGVAVVVTAFWRFRLTRLVQFLPYPVICGFLAGVGWLVLNASVRIVTGYGLSLSTLDDLFLTEAAWRILSMVVGGLSIFYFSRRFPTPLTMPAALLAIVTIFYAVTMLAGVDLVALRSAGWVFGPFAAAGPGPALKMLSFAAVDWTLVVHHIGGIVVVVLVSVVSMLVFLTGIEVALRREIDINHELKVVSASCLLNGGLGVVATYPTAPLTILFNQLGARSRLLGLTAASVVLVAAILGPSALNYMPKVAFSALLFFVALGLLIEWLWKSYARLSHAEYVILVIIFLTVVFAGFLEAVALGILVCAIFFVLKYSTLSLTKTETDGSTLRSDVDRSFREQALLGTEGNRLLFFRLESYLFFGTASLLLNRIRGKVENLQHRPAYIVLDLHDVSGMDSSALFAFMKLRQLVERENMVLVLTGVSEQLLAQFHAGDVVLKGDDSLVRIFGETDYGVEWVEEQLIAQAGIERSSQSIQETLDALSNGDHAARTFANYLHRIELAEGQYLYRMDDPGRDVYFIEQGTISLMVPLDGGGELRLRKLGPGTVAGELDFYDGNPRDANALVTTACVLWKLPAEQIDRLVQDSPEQAAMFHAMMARAMSMRVGQLSNELRSVVH